MYAVGEHKSTAWVFLPSKGLDLWGFLPSKAWRGEKAKEDPRIRVYNVGGPRCGWNSGTSHAGQPTERIVSGTKQQK